MPSIKAFKGVMYNKEKVKDLSKVVAPPYDVIPPKMQDELYRKHANNIVRLILGKIENSDNENDNRYTRARDFFNTWLSKQILIQDEREAVYVYSQTYKYDNKSIERIGFISLMKLDLKGKSVLPHENTLKAPKADRLNLIRNVKANLSPIFMLYEDDKRMVEKMLKENSKKVKPFIDVNIESVRHRVWRLDDKDLVGRVKACMEKKNIFIADGHHRYETSVNYALEVEAGDAPQSLKESSRYFMAYFVGLDDDHLTILPTHRLIRDTGGLGKENIIKKLEKYFGIKKIHTEKGMLAGLKALKEGHAFGIYFGKGMFYIIALKSFDIAKKHMGGYSEDWKSLDVSIVHLFVLQYVLGIRDEDDNIEFVKDAKEAVISVDKDNYEMALILNPTKVSQVKKVAENGEKMPRKATYFYPKPLSGLVINKF